MIAVHLQYHFSRMQCHCSGCNATSTVLECGCIGREVSNQADAVCFVRGCSAHEGGCGEPAVVAVPHRVSLNSGCSVHAVQELSHKLDAVCCDGGFSDHEGRCSDPVVLAVDLQYHFSWLLCPCSGCSAPCIVPECGFSAQALDAVSHKVHAACCDRGCSAHEGG